MLTINADNDPLFCDYHHAGTEKRMVVILPEDAYGDWLTAPAPTGGISWCPSHPTSSCHADDVTPIVSGDTAYLGSHQVSKDIKRLTGLIGNIYAELRGRLAVDLASWNAP